MDLVKNFSLFLEKSARFQTQTLYSKKPGSFIIHTRETLWYIKTYFTKIRISQLWSFYSLLSNMHTLHLLLLLLLKCQIRIHRSHSSAFVSSTFRGLSPCRGAGALPGQLKHPSCLRKVEVGWRGYLCPHLFPSIHPSIPLAGTSQEGPLRALLTKNPTTQSQGP